MLGLSEESAWWRALAEEHGFDIIATFGSRLVDGSWQPGFQLRPNRRTSDSAAFQAAAEVRVDGPVGIEVDDPLPPWMPRIGARA